MLTHPPASKTTLDIVFGSQMCDMHAPVLAGAGANDWLLCVVAAGQF